LSALGEDAPLTTIFATSDKLTTSWGAEAESKVMQVQTSQKFHRSSPITVLFTYNLTPPFYNKACPFFQTQFAKE